MLCIYNQNEATHFENILIKLADFDYNQKEYLQTIRDVLADNTVIPLLVKPFLSRLPTGKCSTRRRSSSSTIKLCSIRANWNCSSILTWIRFRNSPARCWLRIRSTQISSINTVIYSNWQRCQVRVLHQFQVSQPVELYLCDGQWLSGDQTAHRWENPKEVL